MGSSSQHLQQRLITLQTGRKGLEFLKYIKVPVHEITMMSIAFEFIPILIEETDKIMAQMARGADFESGNIIKKAKALIPILGAPSFISVQEGLIDCCNGYGGEMLSRF